MHARHFHEMYQTLIQLNCSLNVVTFTRANFERDIVQLRSIAAAPTTHAHLLDSICGEGP